MSTAQAPVLDMDKLNAFIGQFVTDLGASVHAGMVVIGEKLGLYKALAAHPMDPAELAAKTQTDERYLREWLASQAAGGYITYDDATGKFSLSEEQAFTLANEDSPAYLPGAFELALGSLAAVPRIAESFRTGEGMGWHEHEDGVFHGCEKFFRPGYAANLVSSWIPALTACKRSSKRAREWRTSAAGKALPRCYWRKRSPSLASSASTTTTNPSKRPASPPNAKASPTASPSKSRRQRNFRAKTTTSSPSSIACTIWATRSARLRTSGKSLAKDGTWMIVEPFANDQLKDNLNPVGRVYYSFSTLLCTPCSRSQEVGLCLGAQAGEARIRDVVTSAGFTRFRRATETPFNIVYEARP